MVSKKKVLIVEDEKALSRVMQLKFSSLGYEVVIVEDGKTAIESFDKENPDIVLLDLMIPIIDGFSVLTEIRETKKSKTPVFILSNLGQKEDVEKAKKLGAQEYFVKANTPIADIVSGVQKFLK